MVSRGWSVSVTRGVNAVTRHNRPRRGRTMCRLSSATSHAMSLRHTASQLHTSSRRNSLNCRDMACHVTASHRSNRAHLIGLIGLIGLIRLIGLIGLIRLIGLIGLIGPIEAAIKKAPEGGSFGCRSRARGPVVRGAVTYFSTFAVSSAWQGLTSLFGMGRGGALALLPPWFLCLCGRGVEPRSGPALRAGRPAVWRKTRSCRK